jgi:hypothetical protein
MKLAHSLAELREAERVLAEALVLVSHRHVKDAEVHEGGRRLAGWSAAHVAELEPFTDRYGRAVAGKPHRVSAALLRDGRVGGPGLLSDLQDLAMLAHQVHLSWVVVGQAARALRDEELHGAVLRLGRETDRQIAWIRTHIQLTAPQALTVPGGAGSLIATLSASGWGAALLGVTCAAALGSRRRGGGYASGALAALVLGTGARLLGRRLARPVAARQRLNAARRAIPAGAP